MKTLPFFLLLSFVLGLGWSCQSEPAADDFPGESAEEATLPDKANTPFCAPGISLDYFKELGPPLRRDSIGNSHLPITTSVPEAQLWFDQGLNMLHAFWHIEAYRAFRQVIALDSSCAMGWWGMAMSQPGFGSDQEWEEWPGYMDRALALRNSCTPFERALIVSCAPLLKGGPDAAAPAFRKLVENYPNEAEVLALAGMMIRQTNANPNGPMGEEVKGILQRGLELHPEHTGLLHYYTHILELRPEYARAIPAALKAAEKAPLAPHIQHMPGHLYFQQGDYQKAIEVYKRSNALEEAYHEAEDIPLRSNQQYLHNLHFLTICEAELGHYEAALQLANRYADIALPDRGERDLGQLLILYNGRLLPAWVHIRYRDWPQARAHLERMHNLGQVLPSNFFIQTYIETLIAFTRGMEAAGQNDFANVRNHLHRMGELMTAFNEQGASAEESIRFPVLYQTFDLMQAAYLELEGWSDNLDPEKPFFERAWHEAQGLERAIGYTEPPRLMYPVAESLGRLYVHRKEYDRARQAFELALQQRPNSGVVKGLLGEL